MIIERTINGEEVKIELTDAEMSNVMAEVVIGEMKQYIMNVHHYKEEVADELAHHAYWAHYFDDEGSKKFCIDIAIDEYVNKAITLDCEK